MGKEGNTTANKRVASSIVFVGKTSDGKKLLRLTAPNMREDEASNMAVISGKARDLPPPEHETTILSRPALPGSLLKFLLSFPHALSIRLTDPAGEAGPLFTSLDAQFAISIRLDISTPQSKSGSSSGEYQLGLRVFLVGVLDRFDRTQG